MAELFVCGAMIGLNDLAKVVGQLRTDASLELSSMSAALYKFGPQVQMRYLIPGTPPATLTPHVIDGKTRKPVITLIEYDERKLEERTIDDPGELLPHLDNKKVSWINIDGLGDVEALRILGEKFHLHPLTLKMSSNTGQRPKAEQYDVTTCSSSRRWFIRTIGNKMCGEQVSMFGAVVF